MALNKTLSFIGIAQKAGKVVSGEFSVEKSVKEYKACLVIIAEDASDNTKKMFRNMCTYRDIPMYIYSNKEDLGRCIGKQFRASLAVTDDGFANTLQKQLSEQNIECIQ